MEIGMRIAVMGQMRSGKDTVAELLKLHDEYSELKFSDGIKELVKEYFPEMLSGGKPRKVLQDVGQFMRSINQYVWVSRLNEEKQHLEYQNSMVNIIVTDVRQENEVEYLKRAGFILIKVTADEQVRKTRILAAGDTFSEEMLSHETEIAVLNAESDYVIENNGTLEELKEKVDEVLFDIKKEKCTVHD